MDLSQIEAELQKSDFQYRLKAISALKEHPSEIAVPVLIQHINDPEFLVRSFVARELGHHQTSCLRIRFVGANGGARQNCSFKGNQ